MLATQDQRLGLGPGTVSSQTGGQGTVPEADEHRCRDEAEKVAKS